MDASQPAQIHMLASTILAGPSSTLPATTTCSTDSESRKPQSRLPSSGAHALLGQRHAAGGRPVAGVVPSCPLPVLRPAAQAQPAELAAALRAYHVHAALVLLDRSLALGAGFRVGQHPVCVFAFGAVFQGPLGDRFTSHLQLVLIISHQWTSSATQPLAAAASAFNQAEVMQGRLLSKRPSCPDDDHVAGCALRRLTGRCAS